MSRIVGGVILQFFFIWYSGGGVQLGPLGTAATNRPIVPAPGDYDDGEICGMIIGRETEVLGENLPQCRSVHHKPHILCSDANPGHSGGKPATNRLSYGIAVYATKRNEQDSFGSG
jgi:hypothetical protein